jgi:uncharacterized protein YrzB (UPF0473 family)
MGFFSWNTQDTNRSISNSYSGMGTFTVTMMDDNGNRWVEENYEGYGEFDGKDYYELLAEMNGLESDRSLGLGLAFKDNPSGDNTEGVIYPNLVEYPDDWLFNNKGPESCEYQGYFYPDTVEHGYDE